MRSLALAAPHGARSSRPPTPAARTRRAKARSITGGGGGSRKLAVPDFLAADARRRDARRSPRRIGQVLWNDLDFEREFDMIPRDTYAIVPAAASIDAVPFDRWRELGADGVVIGAVRKTGTGVTVQVRLFNVAGQTRRVLEGIQRHAPPTRALFAHTIADEIHKQQRNLNGVARTKLDLLVRSRRRADAGHDRRPRRSRRSTSPTTTARTRAASR